MFKFLSAGIEFVYVGKVMNKMVDLIKHINLKIDAGYTSDELAGDVLMLAYMARKGVIDRIEEYNWTLDVKITIFSISNSRVTLLYAYSETVGKLYIIATQLGMVDEVQNVLEKGKKYYEIEKVLPASIIKSI